MKALILSACIAVACACSRPAPSPEYERARVLWAELSRVDPRAAAEDPRADAVLTLLARVPDRSSDALAAGVLRDHIGTLRREAESERARREEALRRAAAPAPGVIGAHAPDDRASVSGPGAPSIPEPRTAKPGVAAAGDEAPVRPGMSAEELRSGHGDCVAPSGPATLTAPGAAPRPGEIWTLVDAARCRIAYPSLVGRAVVVAGGQVETVRPLDTLERHEVRRDVEAVTLPDGRPGMVVDGKVVPLPPGARVVPRGGGTAP